MVSFFLKLYKDEKLLKIINFSLIFFIIFFIIFKFIAPVIFPFLISFLIAIIFNPLIKFVTKWKIINRGISSLIIIIFVLFIFFSIFFFASYYFKKIFNYYSINFSSISNDLSLFLSEKFNQIFSHFSGNINEEKIRKYFSSNVNILFSWFFKMGIEIFNSMYSIFSYIPSVILIPFVTFYFMKDFDNIFLSLRKRSSNKLLSFYDVIKPKIKSSILMQIRGQLKVMIFMFIFYSVTLFLIGLEKFLICSLISSFATFIPFLGLIISLILAICLSISFGNSLTIILEIILIYSFGAILESSFLTPKFVSNNIKLHPILIFFSIMFFFTFFGILGGIFAITFANVLNIIIKEIKISNLFDFSDIH